MNALRYRQIHLDFHTSEAIPNIGKSFNKEQFQAALKRGHVNSITLFAKCHHGWAYFPSEANEMHPNLEFDLLSAQLEACREIDVKTPIYISAGWDEKYANRHPDHLIKGSPTAGADFLTHAHYHMLCYNTPYLDTLVAQIEEVMQKFNPIGLFIDISAPRICYCNHCLASMRKLGLDPHNFEDVKKHSDIVYAEYCRRCEEAVRKYNPDTNIFHNAGHITRGRRDHAYANTHLEIESLPTGGWGYDHFPMSVSYARTLGMDMLSMTGKFHTWWGEFGGFKHPNALRYEVALSLAEGTKCSIGDQLHPSGEMNFSTYDLIGKAYREVEAKEPYVDGAKHLADIAVLSAEAFSTAALWKKTDRNCLNDVGACRILLEGKYLFDLVDRYQDLSSYKLLILPDVVRLDDEMQARLAAYLASGGKILCSGESGLRTDCDSFALDLGATYEGTNEYCPNYMIPEYEALSGKTAYVMYNPAKNVKATSGTVEAWLEDSYFNRTAEHFCSHQHTPNRPDADHAGAILTESTGYIAWDIFNDYAEFGSYHTKELVIHMIDALLGDSASIKTNLPDRGIATYTYQADKNRYVAHLLFAHTTNRGKNVEVIEDIIPLCGIKLSAAVPSMPKRVYKVEYADGALRETELEYTYTEGCIDILVDKVDLHAMVVIDV